MSEQLRINRVWVLLVVVATLLGMSGETSAEVVTFSDANLEAVVRSKLGIRASKPITDIDMKSIEYFWRESCNFTNIQGFNYATNLTGLNLNDNEISDISPLSGLTKMYSLTLSNNHISDISPLAGLTNLKWVYLGGNQISDISPLSGLPNLEWLYLNSNQVTDISHLSGLTNLVELGLSNNQISDISPLSDLSKLLYLFLSNNQIETMDLRGENLSSLGYFNINNNPLTDVILADSTLSQTSFNALMNGGYHRFQGIAEMPGVLSLDLSGVDFTNVPDLSVMYRADNLETLLLAGATNLDGSQVTQLTGELDSLAWLDVTGVWESFDAGSQSLLLDWDDVEGHTLVTAVPEPATIVLLSALAGLALLRRRRR